MEEAAILGPNYREIVRRRISLGSVVGLILIAISVALALGLPPVYRSKATILIEQPEIPQDLVRSLVTGYADQRLQIIAKQVLTSANLTAIINKHNLYPEERAKEPFEEVLLEMQEDISVTPISANVVDQTSGRQSQATIAFELAYENRSPVLAQRVTNELVTLFLSQNLKDRTESTEETLTFLTRESERLRDRVAELEAELARFKDGNLGKLPEFTTLNLQLMNSREQELVDIDSQLRSLEQQRVYLESELAQQDPYNKLYTESGERVLSPADRLKVLESEFVPLRAVYGENHPDVIAKRKAIEALRAQVAPSATKSELMLKLKGREAELAELEKRYSASHPDVIKQKREVDLLKEEIGRASPAPAVAAPTAPPENPAYIQLKARLDATETEIASLRQRRATVQQQISEYESRLTHSPEVEREYKALTRDYENALAKYQEVLAKRQEAEIAKSLESDQKAEKFTLIEPPVTPEEPAKPNRLAIGALGAMLSVAGGIGAGAIAEALDTRVYGRTGVLRLIGVPPLAVIPRLETSASRRKLWLSRIGVTGLVIIVLAALALAVHFAFRPLDVLYFQVLRALGL